MPLKTLDNFVVVLYSRYVTFCVYTCWVFVQYDECVKIRIINSILAPFFLSVTKRKVCILSSEILGLQWPHQKFRMQSMNMRSRLHIVNYHINSISKS